MNTFTTAGVAAAMLATPGLAAESVGIRHEVAIRHGDREVTVIYQPVTTLSYRQIGNMTPNRPSTARCRWRAEVAVERHLQPPGGEGRHVVRTLVPTRRFEGQTIGRCSAARDQAEAAVARRTDAVRAHLLAVAAEDRAALLAELDAVRGPDAG